MKRNIVTRTITGAAVGLAMMLGITVATAQAQYRDNDYRRSNNQDDRDREWRGGRGDDDRRGIWGRGRIIAIAQQNGYRDGNRRGEQDRQHRRRFALADSNQYRVALSGYRIEYGSRDRYRDAYREGYRRGYIEGFRRGNNRWQF